MKRYNYENKIKNDVEGGVKGNQEVVLTNVCYIYLLSLIKQYSTEVLQTLIKEAKAVE